MLWPFSASGIVIGNDVEDSKYRVSPSEFLRLWIYRARGTGSDLASIVTTAHAVAWQPQVRHVAISGVSREVERLVVHPAYREPPQALLDRALESWDWTLFRALLPSALD